MVYLESDVLRIFEDNLEQAKQSLSKIPVAESCTPNIHGLNGWVYEQTIKFCLSNELKTRGLSAQITDQVPIVGRAKIDLLVGNVAIEVKAAGSFGDDSKYENYRNILTGRGLRYFYISSFESHIPYRQNTEKLFGKENSFFLDTAGEWERFVLAIANSLQAIPHQTPNP